MAKKVQSNVRELMSYGKKRGPDPLRPKNKSKRANYKKYRGQGRG